jgi:hypothetical protein
MSAVTTTSQTISSILLDETTEGNGQCLVEFNGDDTVSVTLDNGTAHALTFTLEGFAKFLQAINAAPKC